VGGLRKLGQEVNCNLSIDSSKFPTELHIMGAQDFNSPSKQPQIGGFPVKKCISGRKVYRQK